MRGRPTGLGQTILEGEVIKTTDSAVLFVVDGDEHWLPRRVCLEGDRLEEGDERVSVANWFLEKEGLL